METEEVEKHLRKAGADVVASLVLRIGRGRYPAVRYAQTVKIGAGCPAWDRGEREYRREALYVLGGLPSAYRRNPGGMYSHGVRFQFDDGPTRWYLGCYSSPQSQEIARERGNPAGPMFLLFSDPAGEVLGKTVHAWTEPIEPETLVLFRRWSKGDVIALFPLIPETNAGTCTSYQRVGQHGAASLGLISSTRSASMDEPDTAALARELEGIGYRLRVGRRSPGWARIQESRRKAGLS